MTGTVPLAIHVPTSTPTASRIKMATIIDETVSLMPCCSSAYGMPKHHAIRHMITPSSASTMRLLNFITRSPTMMTAMPTSSISPACQGFTILFSSMIVVLSRFGWVKLKKDNKKAALSRLGESRFLFTC